MNYKKSVVLFSLLIIGSMVKGQAANEKEVLAPQDQGAQQVPQQKAKQEVVDYGPGIDTIDVETGGNWLQKRVIWEDAQRKYEKIQDIEHTVLESRIALFEKRSESDKILNLFYTSIGFEQGELDEIIDTLLASIEKLHEGGPLTDKEKEIQAKLYEHKHEIEQLKADIKSMVDLDAALDGAVMQLVNQITLANDYVRQAWQKFKDIGQELDDRKAKEYYLQMDALSKNVEAISGYIQGALKEYFNSVTNKLNEYTTSIKAKLEILKKSDIDLKNQVAELEKAKHKEEPKKAPVKKTWLDTISVIWRYPLSLIMQLWGWITSLIWGVKK